LSVNNNELLAEGVYMAAVERSLTARIRRVDSTIKQMADDLQTPYSTVVSWLNGFSPLPDEMRRKIESIISKKEKKL